MSYWVIQVWGETNDLSGSEYLENSQRVQDNKNGFRFRNKNSKIMPFRNKNKIIKSAHDVSDGGVAVKIESCISGGIGAK